VDWRPFLQISENMPQFHGVTQEMVTRIPCVADRSSIFQNIQLKTCALEYQLLKIAICSELFHMVQAVKWWLIVFGVSF
jgi:hypothetical protein